MTDTTAAAEHDAPGRRPRWRGVLTWLLILGAVAGWTAFLRPANLGGSAGYVIVSGESMEPLMHTGDLAIVRLQPTYRVGEVVAYRIPAADVGGGMLVIHRVVGGSVEDGLILRGDNREHPDMWRPKAGDVVGALQAHVPHAGTALFLFRTPLVLGTAAGLLGFWFIVLRGEESDQVVAEDAAPVAADIVEPSLAHVDLTPPAVPVRMPRRSYRSLVGPAVVGVAIGLAVGGTSRR